MLPQLDNLSAKHLRRSPAIDNALVVSYIQAMRGSKPTCLLCTRPSRGLPGQTLATCSALPSTALLQDPCDCACRAGPAACDGISAPIQLLPSGSINECACKVVRNYSFEERPPTVTTVVQRRTFQSPASMRHADCLSFMTDLVWSLDSDLIPTMHACLPQTPAGSPTRARINDPPAYIPLIKQPHPTTGSTTQSPQLKTKDENGRPIRGRRPYGRPRPQPLHRRPQVLHRPCDAPLPRPQPLHRHRRRR